VTTFISFLLTIPFVLLFESLPAMQKSFAAIPGQSAFLLNLFVCGMSFYLYNEMQNVVLGALGPVPTAVGNTLKRVVIFVALYLFTAGETFPFPKILGCAIAIAGCLAYAICDAKKI
jgi:drug/metabolite transporter (DMT)-like permease